MPDCDAHRLSAPKFAEIDCTLNYISIANCSLGPPYPRHVMNGNDTLELKPVLAIAPHWRV